MPGLASSRWVKSLPPLELTVRTHPEAPLGRAENGDTAENPHRARFKSSGKTTLCMDLLIGGEDSSILIPRAAEGGLPADLRLVLVHGRLARDPLLVI